MQAAQKLHILAAKEKYEMHALWKDVTERSPPTHRFVASGGSPKASVAHASSAMSSIRAANSLGMLQPIAEPQRKRHSLHAPIRASHTQLWA